MGFSPEELDDIRKLPKEQQDTLSEFLGKAAELGFDQKDIEKTVRDFAGLPAQENATGQTINQSSVSAEADLLLGGNGQVLTALAASGVDNKQQVNSAAADFALIAQQAIQNGQPLSQVRFSDPNLSQEALEAIYEQVAVKSGTSAAEVERKAEEAKQAEMAMIQNGVFGLAGLAGGGAARSEGSQSSQSADENGQGLAYFDPTLLGTLAPGVQDMRSNEQKLARSGGMALG